MSEAQAYYEQALEADQQNRGSPEAFSLFLKAAQMKHLDAQYMLGILTVESNHEDKYFDAYDWWSKAARRGHMKAQYNLAVCYANGRGTDMDKQLAIRWFQKAAEQGHLNAQFMFARELYQGTNIARDFNKAYAWMERAAKQGHVNAMGDLALMCTMGQGLDKPNATKGYAWALNAQDHGLPTAGRILSSIRSIFEITRSDAELARDLVDSGHL